MPPSETGPASTLAKTDVPSLRALRRQLSREVADESGRAVIDLADAGREAPRYYGEIENSPEAVRRLVARLNGPGEQLKFC